MEDLESVTVWSVKGPNGEQLIEAPTWYLARERYAGASPMDCDATLFSGTCVKKDGTPWEWVAVR